MKRIIICSVSKDTSILIPKDPSQYQSQVELVLEYENKKPLTTVYNSVLQKYRKDPDVESVVFIHGDATVDFNLLLPRLSKAFEKYDIIGLCGAEELNVSQSPLNWYTGSRNAIRTRWGCVTHGENNIGTSFFSLDRKNILDHEVACIDGVFIAFGPKALAAETFQFDEQFEFDQYDTDLCLSAILTYGFKLGVVVDTSLQHFSVGKSILTANFLKHEEPLRKKWKIELK